MGDNVVTLTVTDLHGNAASATAVVTVSDNIPPIAIAQNITIYLDTMGIATIIPEDVNNGSYDNCTVATLSIDKISFDSSNLGDNAVVLTVIDLNNNVSIDTAIVKVMDNMAPIVITKNITVQLDFGGLASITVADINNGSSDNSGIATMVLSKSNFDCSNVGNNLVTLTVTDVNGNISTASSVVLVIDNIKPVIAGLPSNITLNACDITATWIAPTASDNCAGVTIVQTAGPSSGDLNAFTNLTTHIIYTATDASGNSTSAGFTVTRPPVLTSTMTADNPYLHFGYSEDQLATITVRPLGGVGPYTVSITMNRSLQCGLVSGLVGGETWSAANATNTHNSCPVSSAPVSLGSVVASGGALTLTVSLMSDAIIMATITDANGCITTNEIQIGAEDDRCQGLDIGKIKMCHRTGSECSSICVDLLSVASHLAHGDYLGDCGNSCSTPVANPKTGSSTTSSSVASSRTASDETASNKSTPSDKIIQETNIDVEAYPNPFKSSIYVRLSNPEEKSISMNMFDLMGKNVPLKPLNKTSDGVDVLDTERLSAGLYFLQVKIGDYSKTVKLIKE